MAQRIQVLLLCDMHDDDATPGEETVTFALDGSRYEIDLCDEHAGELRDLLAPYVAAGRRPGSGGGARAQRARTTSAPKRVAPDRQRTPDIRRWAREQGMQVPDRGRLPASVVEAFEAAHRS